ncbi:hypothetical protein BO86DRAFT_408310 [Aspergillus japonicus CBS 114.51]|uniref:Uncharacterized protein n=2 Tax=Aspergillus TaxID=5052 RepID=A0A2V5GRW9_ASPV1|nr:hypothetical protein BO86DRAFT_408310 [Aspergillus japonicus CBS 114.51]PYI13491.1 hypothetical protein BO99DRAFT_447597 [Aspergillus violaceofuscus CBS 115571]RAH83751.1 hypothetical protein BO86DRAFT_408310 [Aspergillus japonicus CBS 114.51]
MECLYGRMSYASWRLRQFRQLVNNSSTTIRGPIPLQHNNHHRIRTLSTSTDETEFHPEPPQPAQQPSDTAPKETPAKPTRKPRAKKFPPPSSLLPKSPLLTDPKPGYERLHKKKARSKPSNPEDDLSTNPWAVALASPIRQCSLTGQRMPTEFMTGWGLEQHPEGKSLFIHPSEILPPVSVPVPDPSPSSSPSSSSPDHQKTTQTSQEIRHLRFRMVNRLTLLNTITESMRKSKRKFPAIVLTFPVRWRPPLGPMTESMMASCVWRQDMPQFVTRMMRREVGQRLRRAATQPNDSPKRQVWTPVLPLEDGGKLEEEALVEALAKMEPIARMETGAVLVLRRTAGSSPLPLSSFFHLPQTNSKVPVFDMTRLLAEEDLACAKFQGQAAVFFRPDDKPTVNAMLGLWKLAGLLRDDPHLDPHLSS